jgi:transcriptional regulator with XRE-family HTH domain
MHFRLSYQDAAVVRLDIATTRRDNLRRLVASYGGSGLARLLGVTRSYISQLESGLRPISEKTARKFEEKLGLEAWSLDKAAQESVPFSGTDRQLIADVVRAVSTALVVAELNIEPAKFANLVAEVYEHSVPAGKVDQEYLQRLISILA